MKVDPDPDPDKEKHKKNLMFLHTRVLQKQNRGQSTHLQMFSFILEEYYIVNLFCPPIKSRGYDEIQYRTI